MSWLDENTVAEIYEGALKVPPPRRDEYLDSACGGDARLREAVRAKLLNAETTDPWSADATGPGVPSVEALDRLPKMLGPFTVTRSLGEGGMGSVYLAEQREPHRQVALKLIRPGMDTREVVARFEAERQALAMMDHPAIAKVYEVGATPDGRPYFSMEYVQGAPITGYCDDHRLGLDDRLRVFRQVCLGVHHAHEQGIVHRDLKPSNILVTAADGEPLAKIIDFGVAKAVDQRLTDDALTTQAGCVIGTPAYMSPEQAMPTEATIDARTDVYALGVVLYELLVGELPLDWASLSKLGRAEVLRRVREEEPPTPSTRWGRLARARVRELADRRSIEPSRFNRELRRDLDWIVMKALEKEPARRYRTALDFSQDIDRYLKSEPVVAGPPSAIYRMRKFVRRYRALVQAVGAVVVALAIGLVFSLYYMGRYRDTLADVFRLSDRSKITEFDAAAASLWPARPEMVADLKAWIEGAEALVARLPAHTASLPVVKERWQSESASAERRQLGWHYESLRTLVTELTRFRDRTLASVKKRLDFAETIKARSIDGYRAKWDEAIRSIASMSVCPAYGGLRIRPQVGLVPLGRDPASGLWEFGHLETGTIPSRNSEGRLEIADDTGLVFVLVPGGTFKMGAPLFDFAADDDEKPRHEVRLDPFFISKYEMTRFQWRQFTGREPERLTQVIEGRRQLASTVRHPIVLVSWNECNRVAGRMGLCIPTEAQWEYVARAGTKTPWWTGGVPQSIQGAANLFDKTTRAAPEFEGADVGEATIDDGVPYQAPVGRYRANAFGLHDTMGNVWEWCFDRYGSYEKPVEPGTGRRILEASTEARVNRGGGWDDNAVAVRSSARDRDPEDVPSFDVGLRPARALER